MFSTSMRTLFYTYLIIKDIFLDHMREKMFVYKITLMQDMQGAYA